MRQNAGRCLSGQQIYRTYRSNYSGTLATGTYTQTGGLLQYVLAPGVANGKISVAGTAALGDRYRRWGALHLQGPEAGGRTPDNDG